MKPVRFRTHEGNHVRFIYAGGIAKRFEHLLVIELRKIYSISPQGVVTPLRGLDSTSFGGIAATREGVVYACDETRIYEITIGEDGEASMVVLAGSGDVGFRDGEGCDALFECVLGLCVDSGGNILAADSGCQKIRKISPTGLVSTFAGTGLCGPRYGPMYNIQFAYPQPICVHDDAVYVRDNRRFVMRINGDGSTSTDNDLNHYRVAVCCGELFTLAISGVIYRGLPWCAFQGNGIVGYSEFIEDKPNISEIFGDGDTLYILGPGQMWIFDLAPLWSTETHHIQNAGFKDQVKVLMMLWSRDKGLFEVIPLEVLFMVFERLHYLHIRL